MTIIISAIHVRLAARHHRDRVAAVSRGLVSYMGRAPAREVRP